MCSTRRVALNRKLYVQLYLLLFYCLRHTIMFLPSVLPPSLPPFPGCRHAAESGPGRGDNGSDERLERGTAVSPGAAHRHAATQTVQRQNHLQSQSPPFLTWLFHCAPIYTETLCTKSLRNSTSTSLSACGTVLHT